MKPMNFVRAMISRDLAVTRNALLCWHSWKSMEHSRLMTQSLSRTAFKQPRQFQNNQTPSTIRPQTTNPHNMKQLAFNLFTALTFTAMVTTSAQAQWTYTSGTLNAAQTYDGLGVDSALDPRA